MAGIGRGYTSNFLHAELVSLPISRQELILIGRKVLKHVQVLPVLGLSNDQIHR
jgi:hypothetical protein